MNGARLHSRSTAELDAGTTPLGVLQVLRDLLDVILKGDDADWIGVRLAEHCTKTVDLLCGREADLLCEYPYIALDPILAHALDLGEFRLGDLRFVREIEPKLGGCDQRALLIDVVSKDVTKAIVEDVSGGMVIAERPAAQLESMLSDLNARVPICKGNIPHHMMKRFHHQR